MDNQVISDIKLGKGGVHINGFLFQGVRHRYRWDARLLRVEGEGYAGISEVRPLLSFVTWKSLVY